MITEETFCPDNRTKTIGNSMYRICNTDGVWGTGKWYIHETYNDGKTWCQGNAFHNSRLDVVIDAFNLITEEKEIVSLRYCSLNQYYAPMSRDDAYDYYWKCYQDGIYSLRQLKDKHKEGEEHRKEWEDYSKKHDAGARDYESFSNMQRGLKAAIRDIWQSQFVFGPVPASADELDLVQEAKKIEIVHRTLLCTARKHPLGYGSDYYQNLRAYLINRVEQASAYMLAVDFQGDNGGKEADAVVKIRDKKEYLIEKYGTCESHLCVGCTDNCKYKK